MTVSVPVSARQHATSGQLGNQVGAMPVALPATGSLDGRITQIAAITGQRKTQPRAPRWRCLARCSGCWPAPGCCAGSSTASGWSTPSPPTCAAGAAAHARRRPLRAHHPHRQHRRQRPGHLRRAVLRRHLWLTASVRPGPRTRRGNADRRPAPGTASRTRLIPAAGAQPPHGRPEAATGAVGLAGVTGTGRW